MITDYLFQKNLTIVSFLKGVIEGRAIKSDNQLSYLFHFTESVILNILGRVFDYNFSPCLSHSVNLVTVFHEKTNLSSL